MHLSKKEAGERAVTILEKVGMPDARAAMKNIRICFPAECVSE